MGWLKLGISWLSCEGLNNVFINDMPRKKTYASALRHLTEYAESEGFMVDLTATKTSSIYWHKVNVPRRILIEWSYTEEYKVYLFLHELGHHELRKDWNLFEQRFPIIAIAENFLSDEYHPKYKRRKAYKVECLREEYEAWVEGLSLAKEFNIQIDQINFDALRYQCLGNYLGYYAQ